MRVLVVDDSQIMRKIIIGALRNESVKNISEASDGLEAYEAVQKNPDIDLILMDWNMPSLNGVDAVKKIRTTNPNVPIIMVTTEAEQHRVVEAIKSGANDYLVKPFSPKDIKSKLEKYLK